jgi:hypothetical protein
LHQIFQQSGIFIAGGRPEEASEQVLLEGEDRACEYKYSQRKCYEIRSGQLRE